MSLGELLELGTDRAAGPAPLGPEVDNDRDGGLQDLDLEGDRAWGAQLRVRTTLRAPVSAARAKMS